MAQPRRKCRLADSNRKDVDLCAFKSEIVQTINDTVPGKNPSVYKDYFSTDPLTHSESISVGRALAKIDALKNYGKTITIFRLFDGKTYESESSNIPLTEANKKEDSKDNVQPTIRPKRKSVGGRVK